MGHEVFTPTQTGIGERTHRRRGAIPSKSTSCLADTESSPRYSNLSRRHRGVGEKTASLSAGTLVPAHAAVRRLLQPAVPVPQGGRVAHDRLAGVSLAELYPWLKALHGRVRDRLRWPVYEVTNASL